MRDYDNVDRDSARLNSREMNNDYTQNHTAMEFNSANDPNKLEMQQIQNATVKTDIRLQEEKVLDNQLEDKEVQKINNAYSLD